jgi:transcriptional regulator with XRE-family HTH domain
MDAAQNQVVNSEMLKAVRKKLGLSQKKMAALLKTDDSLLSKIERGVETPDWLVKFAVLSKLVHDSGLSWEDVILELPDFSPRAAEKGGDYNA